MGHPFCHQLHFTKLLFTLLKRLQLGFLLLIAAIKTIITTLLSFKAPFHLPQRKFSVV